jgi:hypothetical protein
MNTRDLERMLATVQRVATPRNLRRAAKTVTDVADLMDVGGELLGRLRDSPLAGVVGVAQAVTRPKPAAVRVPPIRVRDVVIDAEIVDEKPRR